MNGLNLHHCANIAIVLVFLYKLCFMFHVNNIIKPIGSKSSIFKMSPFANFGVALAINMLIIFACFVVYGLLS